MGSRLHVIVRTVVLAALLGMVLVTGDVLLRQASQYREAEQARKEGKLIQALTAYESAIRMYVPGSPLTERSAQAIWALAGERQAAGDTDGAIHACRGLRSAFYAVRSIVTPGDEWIARCDTKIRELEAPMTHKQHRRTHAAGGARNRTTKGQAQP